MALQRGIWLEIYAVNQLLGAVLARSLEQDPAGREFALYSTLSALERATPLSQRPMGSHGVGLADRAQLTTALVQHEPHAAERFEASAQSRLDSPHPLCHRADPPAVGRIEVKHPVRLAVADGSEHDCFGLERPGHTYTLRGMADENGVVLYTTEPCGFCRQAKALLEARGVFYTEVNLAKDPVGRADLVALTGQMTFPQIVVGERSIGGFRELLEADRAGTLEDLLVA